MSFERVLAASAICALTACGGGGAPTTTDPPLADSVLSTDQIDFSRPGGNGSFRFESAGTATEVDVSYSAPTLGGNIDYGNRGAATTTQTGTTTFIGDYAGLIIDENANEVMWTVSGDATITATFGTQQLSGVIANRRLRDPDSNRIDDGNTLADMTLVAAAITDNQVLLGVAEDGGLNGGDTSAGTYRAGIFIGANSNVGGIVNIEHDIPGSADAPEWGIFAAIE